ncbi:MAG: hypothetical protein DHS20C11_28540 [Lysobacteraceae bacterium]|nr:MAG: hypothetical protein DHS20C11_28540 [Xanthomonadaceae bacterium]
MSKYWFTSSQLTFVDGEDEETNHGRYGKAVANWLAKELGSNGYSATVSPEDWGWRVDCVTDPCPIWIGCGNVDEIDAEGNLAAPNVQTVAWHLFIQADVPFLKKLFGKLDPAPEVEKLAGAVKRLLSATDHITEVEEP